MLKCKIISGSDIKKVEEEVNEFLGGNSKIILHSIHQSSDQQRLHISVFYNLRSRNVKMKEAAFEQIAVPLGRNANLSN